MKRLSIGLMLCALALAAPVQAALQGSVFTYQGRLEQNGAPVDGTRNLRFRLFTEAVGGTQIGSDVALPAQSIEGGVFSVALDFGLLAFNGEARFLEIAVDDNTLAPRQLVTNAPYALFALDGGAIYTAGPGIAINDTTISANFGTTAGTVAQGDAVILNQNSGKQEGATFNISGRGRMGDLFVDAPVADSGILALRVRSPNAGGFATDRLRIDTTANMVLLGQPGLGIIPHSGAGQRMMWYAEKAAFRAGGTDGVQWDTDSTGLFSAGFGFNTRALGQASFAAGLVNEALNSGSTAFGSNNSVTGEDGFAAGDGNTCTGSACVALGSLVSASGFSTALGRRVSSGGFSGSFIWGDNSANVSSNTAGNQFVVRASGGIRLRTSSNLGTGCDLAGGSGTFACTSDRNAKHDFRPMDAEEVLLRVTALPVESWRYRNETGAVRHVGPTAQDFRAAYGLGTDDISIGLPDIDGINMLAIQALAARTDELAKKDAEIDALRRQVQALAETVARIEASLR